MTGLLQFRMKPLAQGRRTELSLSGSLSSAVPPEAMRELITALALWSAAPVSIVLVVDERSSDWCEQRMTLRYTQIADETVGREYFEALTRVADRYATIGAAAAPEVVNDPLQLLQDVIRWLGNQLCVGRTEPHARLLIRRLEKVREAISELQREASGAS